jgi:hypothetical protein
MVARKRTVINERNTLTFVTRIGLLLYLVFAVIAAGVWASTGDLGIMTGTLLGGGLSLVNFDLLKRIGRKIVEDPKRLKVHYFALVWFKFMALITICFCTVYYQLVNIPAFFVSLGVIIVAIVTATIYAVYQGFTDLVDEDMAKGEEKYIGWDDVDNPVKKGYKTAKKSVFDKL